MRAVIYTRVSTDEQADKGFSLRHQKEALEKYCEVKGITIVEHFQDDYSAKTFDRPSWKRLHEYVRANRRTIDMVLFTRWDRFSRNISEAYRVIRLFHNMGVVMNSMEQQLDLAQPDSKIMLSIYLSSGEVENDKNSIRTREGMRKAMMEGCFATKPPFGYIRHRNEMGRATALPDPEKAEVIRYAFAEFARGIYAIEELRIILRRRFNVTFRKNSFAYMLKNPVYNGKIVVKAWKEFPEMIVDGLHEPLVDDLTFTRVQDILEGRRRITKYPARIDENLPLRGFLECPRCGRNITGSASTSRNKTRHYYYHCTSACGYRYRAADTNSDFRNLLLNMQPAANVLDLYVASLEEYFKDREGDKEKHLIRLDKELVQVEGMLEALEDKFFSGSVNLDTYNNVRQRYTLRINDLKHQIEELQLQDQEFMEYVHSSSTLLHNLERHYTHSDIDNKQKLIGSIFPEKLIYENSIYRTTRVNEVIGLLFENTGDFRGLRIEKRAGEIRQPKKAPPLTLFSNHFIHDMRLLHEIQLTKSA